MAAVAVPPSPAATMSTRRIPLANLQNATNSPARPPAGVASKKRSHASEQRDLLYGQQPPAKKQIVEVDDAESRRYGLSRRSGAPATSFQKKLEAVRDSSSKSLKPVEKSQRGGGENLEVIRQWQKHYRKMFPTFVFYFESIPDDVKSKVYRQVITLGAREVKFFSKEATHVITTRPIPPELESSSSSNAKGTINPAQLETKKSVFDTALQKNNGDILHKARELGMKIWPAEKLQRMLNTMFNTDTGEQPPQYNTRHGSAVASKPGRQTDLGKLLQNEHHSVATQDLIQLRGYYVYIHDMDELTRPVMVREYSKVPKKEEGKWPQFRVSGLGKCPFVIDPHHTRKQQEQDQEDQRARAAKLAAPRTRAAAALEEKRALVENNNLARRPSATTQLVNQEDAKPLEPPKVIPAKRANPDSMPPMFGSAQANIRAIPRFAGGEPVASGIQPSNITSAIQSAMISSTAAGPGCRAGNSKEVNQLMRKVLDKNTAAPANAAHTVIDDMRAALNQEYAQPPRAAKRRAQDALGFVKDEAAIAEQERQARKTMAIRRRKTAERELKPGYCENCREKFNDFDEHTMSRKHRKFAVTLDNWLELDQLLADLVRK